MSAKRKTLKALLEENTQLRARLQETEDTIRAIQEGEVDALVMRGSSGEKVFTLMGADYSYRVILETMREGAATLADNGMILYCNNRLVELLNTPQEKIVGSFLQQHVSTSDHEAVGDILQKDSMSTEIRIKAKSREVPVLVSTNFVDLGETRAIVIIITDLSKQKKFEEALRSLTYELLITEASERRRISEYLHGNICQSLGVAKMRLQHLHGLASESNLLAPLHDISTMVDDAITHIRSLLTDICPSVLYELGLSDALQWLADEISKNYALPIRYNCVGKLSRFDEETRILLFQTTKELLMNIVKHAKANAAFISARMIGSGIRIQVQDDGIGFDPFQKSTPSDYGGFGLFNVRERLHYLGGHMHIASEQGMGTSITITAPRQLKKKRRVPKKKS